MISSCFENFLKAPLSFQGELYSDDFIQETIVELENNIVNQISYGTECYLQEENPLKFCLLFFLLLKKNCPPIPLLKEISLSQKERIIQDSGRAYLSNGAIVNKGQPREKNFEERYYICFTSGTTGTPKECILSIPRAIKNAKEHSHSLGITSQHTVIQNLPLQHSFGIVAYLLTTAIHQCGLDFSPIFLTPKNMKKRQWKKTVFYASSSQLKFMLREKDNIIPGVEIVSFGAGVVSSEDVLEVKAIFPDARLFVTYGLTELGPRVSTGEILKLKDRGYIGKVFPCIQVRVLDDNGEIQQQGVGRLAIESPCIKMNLSDKEIIKEKKSARMFYLTQDTVDLRSDGEIYFISRSDDLIKVGGISIYPMDIETVVKRYNGVIDAIVLPESHPLYGDVPVLFVQGTIELKSFQLFLSQQLSTYQIPKRIIVLDDFPRISLNKIDRKFLKEKYLK